MRCKKSDLVQRNQSEHEENEGSLNFGKMHTEMNLQLTHQIRNRELSKRFHQV